MAAMSERTRAAYATFAPPHVMAKASQAGYDDAMANRRRAPEHDSYLGKDAYRRTESMAYNRGYITGMQQALQDRYGNPPD